MASMTELRTPIIFDAGSTVTESGYYVCVPCGDKRYFKAGSRFTACLKCFGKNRRRGLTKGLELWEKINENS